MKILNITVKTFFLVFVIIECETKEILIDSSNYCDNT